MGSKTVWTMSINPIVTILQKPFRPPGDYPGEAWIRLEYGGAIGAPFRELYVDFDTLSDRADQAGWKNEIVRGERDNYSARLTLHRR